jgi:hypothetical protein
VSLLLLLLLLLGHRKWRRTWRRLRTSSSSRTKTRFGSGWERRSCSWRTTTAEAMLEKALEETKAEVDALEAEKRELQGAMAELKGKLYEKFGNAINLEE